MSETKRILVLGGFAGVECVRKLESYFPNENEVQLQVYLVSFTRTFCLDALKNNLSFKDSTIRQKSDDLP
jgi:NADH dehydrogenase FAD-containing subunit